MLKETSQEKGCFRGCLVSIGIGGIIGAIITSFFARSLAGDFARSMGRMAEGWTGAIFFLALSVGFIAGGLLGGIVGLIIERISTRREKEANDF